ncbi:Palmitoyltransferase [Phytophthora megakarya]|uniref:Palmitoyltransferase n=1 Tax=Phytophthora megakarya TaxID=4795 RepID=A0A225WT43_9STRA|nr:Palmitoyltransferase [Phytophthora megakarya]
MAISKAVQAVERQELLQEEKRTERALAEATRRRVADSVFRLLTVHEARHQMNALHLAVLYEHPIVVAYLVSVAKNYFPRDREVLVHMNGDKKRHIHLRGRQNGHETPECSSDRELELMDEETNSNASTETQDQEEELSCGTLQDFLDSRCGDSKHRATALMLCTSVACASTLIDSGASLDAMNSSGMTAMHYAASTGNAAFVSLLVYRGADVNQTDSRGATALHWAVFEGYQYTAMLLVGYGANQKICDSEKQTPLMIASALGDAFLAKQLVVEGAPVKAKDKHGRTAMDIARQGAHFDTVSASNDPVSNNWAGIFDFHVCYVRVSSTLLLHGIHVGLVACATIFGLPTATLLIMQLRNVSRNLTTNEVFNKDKYPYLKTAMDEFYNPFDLGCAHNFAEVCRGEVPTNEEDEGELDDTQSSVLQEPNVSSEM